MRILHARTGELITFLLPDFRRSLLPPIILKVTFVFLSALSFIIVLRSSPLPEVSKSQFADRGEHLLHIVQGLGVGS